MKSHQRISNSERTRAGCLHKWFLSYALGLALPHKPLAMYRGILWHEALEKYTELGLADTLDWLDLELDIHLGKVGQHYLKTAEATAETFRLVKGMLPRYLEHWQYAQPWKVLETECLIKRWTRCPTGRCSSATGFVGVIDKLVQIQGSDDAEPALWIVEHKTTTMKLDEWWRSNLYKPQAPSYAWLIREELGKQVRGVIYDVALAVEPRPACNFDTTKDGKRLHKPKPGTLPMTTADNWARAIKSRGFSFNDQPWYVEIGKQLRERDQSDFWFRRFTVPITGAETDRAGAELWHEGTRLRRLKTGLKADREALELAAADPSDFSQVVAEICQERGAEFPRNHGMCRQYNRRCEYLDLCQHQSAEAAGDFVLHERDDEEEDKEDG